MILVCGGLADTVTELVCARLEQAGYPYRLLDLGFYPANYQIFWQWQGAYPRGYIATSAWRLELEDISGVYARYLGVEGRQLPEAVPSEAVPAFCMECDSGISTLLEYLPCAVINRMSGSLSNNSKLYQALLVRRCGLLTPPTLLTTDEAAARAFYEQHHGAIIYKSLSGIRSIVRRVGQAQLARLPLLQHGPTQFQAFIPGDNVRVHTVGQQIFATRVLSEAVDYRYAGKEGQSVEMEPVSLPPAVSAACLRLAQQLGLLLAGIDLKVTPHDEYYCFEINPSPGFIYYEKHTGQPISQAIADLLHSSAAPKASYQEVAYDMTSTA